jgi:hypothetical protein
MDISDKDIASYLLGGQAASDQGLDQKFDFNFGRSVFTGLFADFQMREQYAFTGHRTCFVPRHLKYDEYVFVPGALHLRHPANAYRRLFMKN